MTARVTTRETVSGTAVPGGREWPLVPRLAGSELVLTSVRIDPGEALEFGDDDADTIAFVFGGGGAAPAGALRRGSALLLLARERVRVTAGAEGLDAVRGTIGPAVDLHAPMGPRVPLEQLDDLEEARATGARSFQVLFDASVGSTRATAFVGHIPPGRAPWHYHLYDEIVWVFEGEGRLHHGDTQEALGPGSAFRLRPREVHIVENTSAERPLSVLGLFTPAGSPSAAYLEADVFAEYVAPRPG